MQTVFTPKLSSRTELCPMIMLPQKDFQYVVPVNSIIRVESASSVSRRKGHYITNGEGNYSYVYLLNGEAILISKKIGDCEKTLASYGFIRPHQSHLVYLPYVKKIQQCEGNELVLVNGDVIPVSFRRKAALQKHNLLVKIA